MKKNLKKDCKITGFYITEIDGVKYSAGFFPYDSRSVKARLEDMEDLIKEKHAPRPTINPRLHSK